jgi:hypothetical protein
MKITKEKWCGEQGMVHKSPVPINGVVSRGCVFITHENNNNNNKLH